MNAGLQASDVGPFLAREEAKFTDIRPGARKRVLRAADDTPWGGYAGYFADPEGHVWEIACNPGAPLGPDGAFRWNGYG